MFDLVQLRIAPKGSNGDGAGALRAGAGALGPPRRALVRERAPARQRGRLRGGRRLLERPRAAPRGAGWVGGWEQYVTGFWVFFVQLRIAVEGKRGSREARGWGEWGGTTKNAGSVDMEVQVPESIADRAVPGSPS
jgi:hypothetical protein